MKTAAVAAGFLLAFASTNTRAQLQSRAVPNRGVESFTFDFRPGRPDASNFPP